MSGRHPDGEQLNAYLLDELDPGPRQEVQAHVAGCAGCRAEVGKLAATLAQYREAAPEVADEAALQRLLTTPGRRLEARVRWRPAAMAAAAAVVIFMGGFWTGRHDASQVAATVPAERPAERALIHHQPDREPPAVTFAVADTDLLGGRAPRDTTWN